MIKEELDNLKIGDELELVSLCTCGDCEASKKENLGGVFIYRGTYIDHSLISLIRIEGWSCSYNSRLFKIAEKHEDTNLKDWL